MGAWTSLPRTSYPMPALELRLEIRKVGTAAELHLPYRSMNTLEHQAHSFFLRCRARAWQPRSTCNGGSRCRPPAPRPFSSVANRREEERPLATETPSPKKNRKPYYVTTPIYYVNAGQYVSRSAQVHTELLQNLTLVTSTPLSSQTSSNDGTSSSPTDTPMPIHRCSSPVQMSTE